MNAKVIKREIVKYFWLLILGSILGFLIENIYTLIVSGYLERKQGLIYGPFIPIYGFGMLAYYLGLKNVKGNKYWLVFLLSMIIGSTVEYFSSFAQEKLFGTVSWDYSSRFLNINGRTCLLYSFYWGIIGVAYFYVMKKVEPFFNEIIDKKTTKIITVFMVIFVIADVFLTYFAAVRQWERRKNIEPRTQIENLIDRIYTDEFLDKIYTNKKEV